MKKKMWSDAVTKGSNALDLEQGVFTWKDPCRIARSLKRSADMSRRRKAPPLASAMAMLNFYMNRAGKNLDSDQKQILQQTKIELRKIFHREPK